MKINYSTTYFVYPPQIDPEIPSVFNIAACRPIKVQPGECDYIATGLVFDDASKYGLKFTCIHYLPNDPDILVYLYEAPSGELYYRVANFSVRDNIEYVVNKGDLIIQGHCLPSTEPIELEEVEWSRKL